MDILDSIVLTHIDGVFTVPSAKGRFVEMENRVDFGLSFCTGGKITYTQGAKQIVSDKQHAVFLPQGGAYTLRGDETGTFPLINFRTLEPFTEKFIAIKIENLEVYIKELQQIKELLANENHAKAFSVFYKILDRLKNEGRESSILLPAVKYMAENLGRENLSNADIAKELNISEVWFRKLFKEHYGTTPHKYLVNLRIERAKHLLSDKRLTVTEIGELCGFSGVYHFCKAFKDNVGATPSVFRKSLENIEL